MTVATAMTADELLALPDDGSRYELVRGELRKMSPAGADHGVIAARIIISLGSHVRQHKLGEVFAAEAGFRIARTPDTVRAPDAAFVRAARVVRTPKFFEGAPDAAFEVVSPGDTYTAIEEKTLDWLRAGTRVVVIADPRTQSVIVRRENTVVPVHDMLEIEDVVPRWRLPLSKLFA
ncbi:MAG TPA: Uma2 family endonuclease [Thermoanaerobaculia bacterium]|nr:Uma2 family endonuclease [Thermoanaerobaculia bacterium]